MLKKSVNSVLILYVAIAVILGVGALILYVSSSSQQMALELQGKSLEQLAQNIALELEEYVVGTERMTTSLSIQQAVLEAFRGSPARTGERFKSYMKDYQSEYWAMLAFDDKGEVLSGYNADMKDLSGEDQAGNDYVKAILAGQESFVSREIIKTDSGVFTFAVSRAIKDESGKTIGGVAVFPKIGVFFDTFVYPLRFGARGYGFALDSKGIFIAHAMDKTLILENFSENAFIADAVRIKNGFLQYTWKGENKVMAFATAPRTDWTICMSAYNAELAETATRQAFVVAGIGATIIIFLVAAITLLNRRLIIRPMLQIENFTQRVAAQDYKAELSEDFRYELGRLSGNIKTMVSDLKNRLGFSQGLLNGMTTPYLIADLEEKILFINKPVLKFLERDGDPEDYKGWTISRFFYSEEGHATITGRAMRENRAIENVRTEVVTNTGSKAYMQADAAPLYDLTGKLVGGIILVTDITELHHQQEEIMRQNARIAKAAEEARDVSEQTAQASEELSTQIKQSSRGADIQRERIQEMATAIEEMNATVLEVAKNASNAADNSEVARDKAQEGADIVRKVVAAIEDVQRESTGLKENMSSLGQQVEGIGHIMSVISDIADQTNLLALNAAIEAARAGEAGRGFAVVADEVRKLAEKTMTATQEVGKSITGIQQGARDAVARMDGAVESVDRATALAEQSGAALSEIVALAKTSSDQIRSIAAASEEQSATSEEISRSVDDINRVSTETAEAMAQSATAVAGLAEQAAILGRLTKDLQNADSGPKALT